MALWGRSLLLSSSRDVEWSSRVGVATPHRVCSWRVDMLVQVAC